MKKVVNYFVYVVQYSHLCTTILKQYFYGIPDKWDEK